MASRSLNIVLRGKDRGASRAIDKIDRKTKRATSSMKMLKAAAAAAIAAIAVRSTVGGIGSLLSLASDAEENSAKFGEIFTDQSELLRRELKKFAGDVGRNRFELEKMAADLGALIKPMGFTSEEAAGMSATLSKLAIDLASFNNVAEDEVLVALRAGLVGEAEPLRRLGVQLSAAKVEAEALAKGWAKTKAEITPAMKAQARFNIIMRETTLAQGDAERTQDSLANQTRRFKAQLAELGVEVGNELLPVATDALTFINENFKGVADTVKSVVGVIGSYLRNFNDMLELSQLHVGKFFVESRDVAFKFLADLKANFEALVKDYVPAQLNRLLARLGEFARIADRITSDIGEAIAFAQDPVAFMETFGRSPGGAKNPQASFMRGNTQFSFPGFSAPDASRESRLFAEEIRKVMQRISDREADRFNPEAMRRGEESQGKSLGQALAKAVGKEIRLPRFRDGIVNASTTRFLTGVESSAVESKSRARELSIMTQTMEEQKRIVDKLELLRLAVLNVNRKIGVEGDI